MVGVWSVALEGAVGSWGPGGFGRQGRGNLGRRVGGATLVMVAECGVRRCSRAEGEVPAATFVHGGGAGLAVGGGVGVGGRLEGEALARALAALEAASAKAHGYSVSEYQSFAK